MVNRLRILLLITVISIVILLLFYLAIVSITVFGNETSIYNVKCPKDSCFNANIIIRGWPLVFQIGRTGIGGSGTFEAFSDFNTFYYVIDWLFFIILPVVIIFYLIKKYRHFYFRKK